VSTTVTPRRSLWRCLSPLPPDSALFQLGHSRLTGFTPGKPKPAPDDPRVPTLIARLTRNSATAYAVRGGRDEAARYLAEANNRCEPRDAFERACEDLATAGVQLRLGELEAAERFAASAVRSFSEGHYRRGHTIAELLLSQAHIRAGEPQGLTLAPRGHRQGEDPAFRRRATRTVSATGRRPRSPTRRRHPRTSPQGPAGRHDRDLTGFSPDAQLGFCLIRSRSPTSVTLTA